MSARDTALGPEQSASVHAERRAFVRLASDLAASARPSERGHDVGWPGRVRDISRGGVGLLLQHRFRPGTDLTIELRENSGKLLRTVDARVAHASAVLDDGNPCWLLGCSFAQPLTDEELQALA
jgi:hypothetical protein